MPLVPRLAVADVRTPTTANSPRDDRRALTFRERAAEVETAILQPAEVSQPPNSSLARRWHGTCSVFPRRQHRVDRETPLPPQTPHGPHVPLRGPMPKNRRLRVPPFSRRTTAASPQVAVTYFVVGSRGRGSRDEGASPTLVRHRPIRRPVARRRSAAPFSKGQQWPFCFSAVLRALSIRRRLLALSAAGVVVVVAVGLTAVLALWQAANLADQMERQADVHELTARVRSEALALSAQEKELLLVADDNQQVGKLRGDFSVRDRALRGTLVALERAVDNDPDRSAVAMMRMRFDAYDVEMTDAYDRLAAGRVDLGGDRLAITADAGKEMRAFLAASEQLVGRAREQQRSGRVELSRLSDYLAALLAGATVVLAAMAMVLGYSVNRSISRPLIATLNALEAVARGDLEQQLERGHTDEMGRIATSLGTAIQRMKQDRDEIEQLATTDALTGLTNRRAFSDSIKLEITRARRYGFRMALLLFDIDHFKKINDRHGHGVGDLVLARMGKLIKEQIRTTDIAARWGGEEFVVALPHVGIDGAAVVAARLRIACQELEIVTDKGERVPTSISIGVAELGREDTLHSLAERADHGMYLAKRQGRNRVVINDGTVASMPPPSSLRRPARDSRAG